MLKLIILLSISISFLFSISLLESSYGGPSSCGLEIAAGNNPDFLTIQYLGLSVDRQLTLRQTATDDTTATLKMRGADWLDGTPAKQMDAGHTKYKNQSGTVVYGDKTPLKTTDEILTYAFLIQPFTYEVTFQLQGNLDTPGFTGVMTQVITFSVEC